ncbi:Zn-dependent hydrolase [Acrocarpospora phusangensis]|uniref:Zn-dependent hydrolase n=1 Tax=Acrocarpospora phusangensis TaxID=1070424 RepID=A0A919QGT5_9ACTN|nr:Zn-dependent hydrolase [Acrocarpospora phusangensis]GIH27654.1 Zn-dependent hydrolase [Acrocarpospora phusangensis]
MTISRTRPLTVDATRLLDGFERLRAVGATEAGGVSRPAFSSADLRARELVAGFMRRAGLSVTVDEAANLIGTAPARDPRLPALVLGSHLDTVPDGGAYDGACGVIAAVEVARTLRDHDRLLDRPLRVVAFSNEEGIPGAPAMFGSRAVAGRLDPAELDLALPSGARLAELLDAAGGDSAHVERARWTPGSVDSYFELHIEQGPVLDAGGPRIGVVEGISGRLTVEVTVRGRADHGGTTPMHARRDALVAAAQVVLAVRRLAGCHGPVRVATTGDCAVAPGAWNVVPGEATLTVDLRDLSAAAVERGLRRLIGDCAEIARTTGTRIEVTPLQHVPPTPCDPAQQRVIEDVADGLGLPRVTLPSGAGHDAQWIAGLAPTGMIFIPSRGGVSHSPREWTEPGDLVNGANTLLGCALVKGANP